MGVFVEKERREKHENEVEVEVEGEVDEQGAPPLSLLLSSARLPRQQSRPCLSFTLSDGHAGSLHELEGTSVAQEKGAGDRESRETEEAPATKSLPID